MKMHQSACFLPKAILKQKSARKPANSRPDWGCTPDSRFLKSFETGVFSWFEARGSWRKIVSDWYQSAGMVNQKGQTQLTCFCPRPFVMFWSMGVVDASVSVQATGRANGFCPLKARHFGWGRPSGCRGVFFHHRPFQCFPPTSNRGDPCGAGSSPGPRETSQELS